MQTNYLNIPDELKIEAIQNTAWDFARIFGHPRIVPSRDLLVREYNTIMSWPVSIDGIVYKVRWLVRDEVDILLWRGN